MIHRIRNNRFNKSGGRIHLLILTGAFPREPLRRAADPLQGVGAIQRPALRRAVEYLDRRLAGLRAVKSIAGTYLSVDFTTDRARALQNTTARGSFLQRWRENLLSVS